ncbi:hypothetical protein BGZ83_008354 [Gryganskiella cystojenkinii]|nr:hypothetical protein BGZ83_008354 [Gryganskiella cystojenkinii]
MERPPVSLTTLPIELLSRIFVVSSNPSLVLTCRALNHALAPLSKSIATRIQFLLVRYRNNYVKCVIKGLRWSFFDLGLLNALDRIYRQERERIREEETRQQQHLSAASALSVSVSFSLQGWESWQPMGGSGPTWTYDSPISSRESSIYGSPALSSSSPQPPSSSSMSTATTSSSTIVEEPPRKKRRKKYQIAAPESILQGPPESKTETDQAAAQKYSSTESTGTNNPKFDQEIPLPKDFSMPRRLFKSDTHKQLLRTLLDRGASPSYPSHYPLVRASQRGDTEMVKMLLDAGAPPDQKALRWACVEEQNDVLDIFLERGVKPDGECLRWCVEKGKSKMIDRLLKLGVVPDLKTLIGF